MTVPLIGWTPTVGVTAPGHWQHELIRGNVIVRVADSAVESLSVGGNEVVQRVYVGVRDRLWNTLVGSTTSVKIDRFRAEFTVRYVDDDVELEVDWDVRITRTGVVEISTHYRPERRFSAGKVGLCILHDSRTHAGAHFTTSGPAGKYSSVFPHQIEPQRFVDGNVTALTSPFDQLSVALSDDTTIDFALDGDLFEIQDHRNWSDLSFKTYSTPQSRGWVHEFTETFTQSVSISATVRRPCPRDEFVCVTRNGQSRPGVLLGVQVVKPGTELDLLRLLAPDHLSARIGTNRHFLEGAVTLASQLSLPLEITLDGSVQQLTAIAESTQNLVARHDVRVNHMLVEQRAEDGALLEIATPAAIAAAAPAWGDTSPIITRGTSSHFCAINRDGDDRADIATVVFGVTTQLHSWDSRVVMLGTLALPSIADTCRALHGPDVRLIASPIQLIGGLGPCPTGTTGVWGLPPQIDIRLMGLFGAAWLVSIVAQLFSAGFDSATVLETIGPRGLLVDEDSDDPIPLPTGAIVVPAFHVFSDLSSSTSFFPCAISDPERVAAVGIAQSDREYVLIANLGAKITTIKNSELAADMSVRVLNSDSAAEAMVSPVQFRETRCWPISDSGTLHLDPYATVLIDLGAV